MITQEQVDQAYEEANIEARNGAYFFLRDGELYAGCALGAIAIANGISDGRRWLNPMELEPYTGYDRDELGCFADGFDTGMSGETAAVEFLDELAELPYLNGYEIGCQKRKDLAEARESSEAELALV